MPSTYTLNNGIELIATGEQSGTWGDTTNTNFSLLDTALDGQVTVTLPSAGTSGSPNLLLISDGAASDGRNRMVIFNDGGDLGATAYVRLDPNDAEKIIYVRNDLAGSRSIILFQGTYNASNDYEVPAGTTAVVYFDGAGSGAVAANVFNNAYFDSLRLGSVSVTAIIDDDTMATASATNIATSESIKAYVDAQVGANNELSEVLANGNTTGGTNILITSGDSIAAPDASGTDQAGTDVIVSGGAGTGTGAGGEVLFKVAPAGSTGSSVNALATGMKLDSTKALYVDTINELTASAGVTIDSVLLKDDVVNASDIETSTISANDGTLAINIADSTGAVDIDTSLNVDGTIDGDGLSIIEPTTNLSVLFGTTANSTTSEIKQRAKSSNGAQAETAIKVTGSGGEAISAWEFKADTASGALTTVMDIDGNGDFTIYEADGTTASFFYDADTGLTVNNGQNARDFTVKSDNTANMLYVDGTNDQVGIGTAALDPVGFGNYGLTIADYNANSYGHLTIGGSTAVDGSAVGLISFYNNTAAGPDDDLARIVAARGNSNDSGDLQFQVSDAGTMATAMVILEDRKVGINVSAPATTLEVLDPVSNNFNGGIHIGGNGSNRRLVLDQADVTTYHIGGTGTNSVTKFVSGGTAGVGSVRTTIDQDGNLQHNKGAIFNDTGGDNNFQVKSQNADHMLFVDAGEDRVGIRDSAPQSSLSIKGQAGFETITLNTTSTSTVVMFNLSTSNFGAAKYLVSAHDTVTDDRYVTEILITHDGTTAVATEYGQVGTNGALATYDVDIFSGNVRLLTTPASSNSTNYRLVSTQLVV